ncbi:MAG: hypothetical protein HGJ94_02850 [Desulfosarcina sp.]|nr:hypothetical protein [Desulfosarcina sp.]
MNLRKLMYTLYYCFVISFGSYHMAAAANYTVDNTSDSGYGSLREAIISANAPGSDTITFDPAVFPPASPATIILTSSLPAIVDNNGTTIDGNGGVIITGIDNSFVGMTISSTNNIIRGLQLNGLRLGIEFDRDTVNSHITTSSAERRRGNVTSFHTIL